jgi:hypothetical protein
MSSEDLSVVCEACRQVLLCGFRIAGRNFQESQLSVDVG